MTSMSELEATIDRVCGDKVYLWVRITQEWSVKTVLPSKNFCDPIIPGKSVLFDTETWTVRQVPRDEVMEAEIRELE